MEALLSVTAHGTRFALFVTLIAIVSFPAASHAQDWFRTGTGIGIDKPRIAVPDFAAQVDNAKPHSQLFTQVVRDDLAFSGVVELVSPSFYPTSGIPTQPSELRSLAWTDPPLNSNFVAFGNLSESTSEVVISAWMFEPGTNLFRIASRPWMSAPTVTSNSRICCPLVSKKKALVSP